MEEEIMECFVKGETVEQVQKKFPKYTEAEIRKIYMKKEQDILVLRLETTEEVAKKTGVTQSNIYRVRSLHTYKGVPLKDVIKKKKEELKKLLAQKKTVKDISEQLGVESRIVEEHIAKGEIVDNVVNGKIVEEFIKGKTIKEIQEKYPEYTTEKLEEIYKLREREILILRLIPQKQVAELVKQDYSTITNIKRKFEYKGKKIIDIVKEKQSKVKQMIREGHSPKNIAKSLNVDEKIVENIAEKIDLNVDNNKTRDKNNKEKRNGRNTYKTVSLTKRIRANYKKIMSENNDKDNINSKNVVNSELINIMRRITLINGDGIGPEISDAVVKIIEASGLKIDWDIQTAGADVIEKEGTPLPERVLNSIKENKIALKAPVTTPIGKGFRSVNVQLRKALDLYANLRPCKNLPNVKTKFDSVDIVVVRENTEDLYAGIERQVDNDTAESIKVITRKASERICKFAFDYAIKNDRKEVCVVTKANIMKLSDGLFLESYRKIAENYPEIKKREILVDNLCMQLVQNPSQFDVLVLPNLYGDIVSDLCAGLIGGLGVAQGANIGLDYAVFEPVHGSAPDIKGQNKANPTALLLSAIEMLKYIGEFFYADRIEKALFKTLANGIFTADLGGTASAKDFTDAIVQNL